VKVLNSFDLHGHELIHLPGVNVDIFGPTEADEKDLKQFVLGGQRVDFISVPFVRKAEEIQKIREILGIEGAHIKILAKIENHEGLENFDSILQISDGVIIMRKILGLELPAEKVFLAQKWMIWRANLASKTVIVASNILDTLETAIRIKECNDIASLVIDGADCIQLTNETAVGLYPIESLKQLCRICFEAEYTLDYPEMFNEIKLSSPSTYGTADACAASVVQTSIDMNIGLIIVLTENGNSVKLMAKYRPHAKIFACTFPSVVVRQLQPVRGVIGH
jgi:pyruvate kinase